MEVRVERVGRLGKATAELEEQYGSLAPIAMLRIAMAVRSSPPERTLGDIVDSVAQRLGGERGPLDRYLSSYLLHRCRRERARRESYAW